MSQSQYLKLLEREIHRINKRIDLKILQGQNYKKEAMEHRLLLRKVRYHSRSNFFRKFFPTFAQFSF